MSDDSGDEQPAGAPMWMATFADLMSLLMCFFVLILSFSEMDVIKYKQIADSMRDAFGVQREVNLEAIPKGTSVVATHFQPGKPDPTPIETVQQQTTRQDLQSLRIGNPDADDSDATRVKDLLTEQMQRLKEDTQDDADMLRRLLAREIESGQIDVESEGRTIIVRIREKGSFPSGTANLDPGFLEVLNKTGTALNQIQGQISVEGHTDNIPFRNGGRYGSNWDLSAARAVSVAQQILDSAPLDPRRMRVAGFADTRPQASNDTWEGRAQNRRVEIVVKQPLSERQAELARGLQDQIGAGVDAEDLMDNE